MDPKKIRKMLSGVYLALLADVGICYLAVLMSEEDDTDPTQQEAIEKLQIATDQAQDVLETTGYRYLADAKHMRDMLIAKIQKGLVP